MPSRHRYLFTYDIADDKRRNQVFKTLRDNGDHAQFSVFFCDLNPREFAELQGILIRAIDQRKDQILILDLGTAARDQVLEPTCLGVPYTPPVRVQIV